MSLAAYGKGQKCRKEMQSSLGRLKLYRVAGGRPASSSLLPRSFPFWPCHYFFFLRKSTRRGTEAGGRLSSAG